MGEGFQFTLLSLRIGRVFIMQPRQNHWNYEVARAVDGNPSITHSILRHMYAMGWLEQKKERINPEMSGRPPRVFYRMTESGTQAVAAALLTLQLSTTYAVAHAPAALAKAAVFSTIAVSS